MSRVRNRIIMMILAVGVLATIMVTVQYETEKTRVNRVIADYLDQRITLTKTLLGVQKELLIVLVGDYAKRERLATFIRNPDDQWAREHTRNVIDACGGNAVWIYDGSGKMVYGFTDPSRGDILNHHLLQPKILDYLNQNSTYSGYIQTSEGLMLVVGAPVHAFDDAEPNPKGYFFTGKLLDGSFVAQLDTNTQCNSTILFHQPRATGTDQLKIRVIPLFNPATDKPVAYIKLTQNVTSILGEKDFYNLLFYIKLVLIILVAVTVMTLLLSWVVLPLRRIANLLEKKVADPDAIPEKINEFKQVRKMMDSFLLQQQQLELSEERFRHLAEATTAAIIIYTDKTILFANAATEKMLGYTGEELRSADFLKIIHPDFIQAYKTQISESEHSEGKVWRSESRFLTKSGHEKFVDLTTVVIRLDSGPAFLVTAHDVTDRFRMERELVVAKERAEKSDKLKTVFLSNLSHEVRTPMNAIMGFSNLLKKERVSKEELSEYTEIIIFSTHRLLKLIDDIIQVAHIETGQIVLEERNFSPALLLDELKDYAEGEEVKLGKSSINVEVVIPKENRGLSLFTDRERLRQILICVLDNALKFTEKGTIRFGYKVIGETVKFSVEDTGIGIPPESRKEVFTRFYQVDSGNDRQYQGSGLGLTIARGLVELMGGTIWLESDEDSGTTIHFTLPLTTHDKKEEPLPKTIKTNFDFTGHSVLVVEDDLINSRLLGSMIQAVNAKVHYAYNGTMAVEMVKNMPEIELVLMDIQMPGMDGLEATRNIHFWRKDLPVISQSASAHADDLKKCKEAGCTAHISKPIDTFRLYQIMARILGNGGRKNGSEK
jgi:PAS domain S-box-containing protein